MTGRQLLHQGISLVGALELDQRQRLAIDGGILERIIPLLDPGIEVAQQPLRSIGAKTNLNPHLGQPEIEAGRQVAATIAARPSAGLADPGLRQRVSEQHLRRLAGVTVFGSQFLEEVGHPHGIETGIIERLHADAIRFVFVVAGVVDG